MEGLREIRIRTLCIAALVVGGAQAAAAREVWNCTYEGYGDDPARYVTHFEERGNEIVEAHWPNSLTYRIIVNTHDSLVAVHAYSIPPSFRRDARAGAMVLMIDKRSGRLHRSTTQSGDSTDQVLGGTCEVQ